MSIDLKPIILVDHHAHSLLKGYAHLDAMGFRQCFSETQSAVMLRDHVPHSLHYLDLITRLGALLGVRGEKRMIDMRSEIDQQLYINTLFDDVSIGALIIDDGFRSDEMLNARKFGEFCRRPVFRCCRIEHVLEESIINSYSFEDLSNTFPKLLMAHGSAKTVGLKSIVAYRGGMRIDHVSRDEAKRDFDKVKGTAGGDGKLRITRGPLYHYFLLEAFDVASAFNLPVQLHTGIGDQDADLLEANPLLWKPLLEADRFAKVNFVFLHCYPFEKEAAFMCSIYPNAFMDLSLSATLVSPRFHKVVADAISVAPTTKIMLGTDGHSVPESHWYGALSLKLALERALAGMLKIGFLDEEQSVAVASRLLHGNARKLYELEGLN